MKRLLEDAENSLTREDRDLFAELFDELRDIDERHKRCEEQIRLINKNHEVCQRLDEVLGISKRGNAYLRNLFIHGTRAVLRHSASKQDLLSRWAQALLARRGHNKVCMAIANKMARITWAIIEPAT